MTLLLIIDNYSYDFVEPFTGFCVKRGLLPPVSPEVIHIQLLRSWQSFTKLFQSFASGLMLHTPFLTPHSSHPIPHPIPHTSFLTPHSSHLIPHTSFLTPFLTPHSSHPIPHTPRLTPHASFIQEGTRQNDVYIEQTSGKQGL